MKAEYKTLEHITIESFQSDAEFRSSVVERHYRHVNRGLARLARLLGTNVEVRSSGNYVFDERGEKYLDCGGYGVFTLGHCHPFVVQAVKEQLERNPLSSRSLVNPEQANAAATLASVAPKGLDYVYFCNSGAEATEAGLKLACLNGKHKLISMHGGYHGKTLGALSVTGRRSYREPFQVWLPDVTFVSFGDIDELEKAVSHDNEKACVILEPVQAEGGVIVPPKGYLGEVERLCRRYGAFFILDEIQTGLGRLGAWWGADSERVAPDVLLVGKALSGGVVPIGAAVASAAAYEKLNRDPMLHTSTFSGNPLASVAAVAAIEVIKRENVVDLARVVGQRLLALLKRLTAEDCAHLIKDVRGEGLLLGIEFHKEFLAGDFLVEMLKRNVLVSYSLNAHRVVRLTPPAFLTDSDINWIQTAFRQSVISLRERYPKSFAPRGISNASLGD